MTTARHLELIHAEIDGELDSHGRGELARQLLADPDTRAARDQLHRLCEHLDRLEQDEPPGELKAKILGALPAVAAPLRRYRKTPLRWRYAALIAGVLAGGAVVFESVRGPGPAMSEMTGTMAAVDSPALDTATLANGPISGRVSLYRVGTGLVCGPRAGHAGARGCADRERRAHAANQWLEQYVRGQRAEGCGPARTGC